MFQLKANGVLRHATQNAMFDSRPMLRSAFSVYVFKKISVPLEPFTIVLVFGSRAEDVFQPSMIGCGGDIRMFSHHLVGSITTLVIVLLFWPIPDKASGSIGRL